MATVGSVALTQPSGDPNINEGQTFTHGGQVTGATHGGADYNMHWQWDQGIATWVDIPASGADLTTADTNPQNNLTDELEHTITVTGVNASTSNVRIRTVDNNDSSAEDLSSSQAVTVNVVTANLPASFHHRHHNRAQ